MNLPPQWRYGCLIFCICSPHLHLPPDQVWHGYGGIAIQQTSAQSRNTPHPVCSGVAGWRYHHEHIHLTLTLPHSNSSSTEHMHAGHIVLSTVGDTVHVMVRRCDAMHCSSVPYARCKLALVHGYYNIEQARRGCKMRPGK